MRLATFLPPGAAAALAGEVRGDDVVAFTDGSTVLDRLASGDRTATRTRSPRSSCSRPSRGRARSSASA
jgi:hypothetical protein